MSEPAHTPLPWRTEYGFIGDRRRLFVAADGMDGLLPATAADARFIVLAVNAHADLLAVCRMMVAARSGDVCDVILAMDAAEAAIAKVNGEQP